MMKLKKTLFFLLPSMIVISSISTVGSTGVGVKADDWILYRWFGDYSVLYDLEWIGVPQVTNLSIYCYVANVSETWIWVNYGVFDGYDILDIGQSVYDLSSDFSGEWDYHIALSDLNVNDVVPTWTWGGSPVTIIDTPIRSYPSGDRPTNHLTIEVTGTTLGNVVQDVYFDKATGVLVEMCITIESDITRSVCERVVDTNIDQWVIPEFPSFLILPLFMIATLLAAILYRRKHSM